MTATSRHTDQIHHQGMMSFGDHLEELRRRVLLSLAFPVPAAIVLFFFSDTLIRWLLLPLYAVQRSFGLPVGYQNLAPQEMVVTELKVSFILALILAAPWVLWQAWKFIGPGLYTHERRFVRFLIPGSIIFTLAGVLLMYFAMMPIVLSALMYAAVKASVQPEQAIDSRISEMIEAGTPVQPLLGPPKSPQPGQAWTVYPNEQAFVAVANSDGGVDVLPVPIRKPMPQQYRLSEYISFVLLMFLGVALAFQMPLVVVLLGWLHLASVDWLRERRKYALLICGVAAAILTPSTDIISMLVMMVPLYLLYELGIVLLTILPASAVAEGTIRFPRWSFARSMIRRGDKRREPPDRAAAPAQVERTVARNRGPGQSPIEPSDGGESSP